MARSALPVFIRLLLLGWCIPSVLGLITYYGFVSGHTKDLFSEASFRAQYESGVYKYRVLGRELILAVNDAIVRYDLPTLNHRLLPQLDPNGTAAFYTSYFLVNTFFSCLTCSILFLTLHSICGNCPTWLSDSSLLLMACLMSIGQFVVVPYDMLSYFFLSLAMFTIVRGSIGFWSFVFLCAVMVLAVLTRETAVLIPAFYLGARHRQLLERPTGMKLNVDQWTLIALGFCFVATYVLLHLSYPRENVAFHDFSLFAFLEPVRPFNLPGTLFLCSIVALLLFDSRGRPESVFFLLGASPYLFGVLTMGQTWEVRLSCPIFLCLIVIKARAIAAEFDSAQKRLVATH